MAKKRKETVGKAARDLLMKDEPGHSPIDYEREMHKNYEWNVMECIERGKKQYSDSFYIIVITKKERIMQNVIRNYFTCRVSCPTPEWDQTVYFYNRRNDSIDFLWVVPAKDVCERFRDTALTVSPEERELLKFVLDFSDGTLFEIAKKRNGEEEKSPLLEKKGSKYV